MPTPRGLWPAILSAMLLLLAIACSTDSATSDDAEVEEETGIMDIRTDPEDPPEGGLQIITPEFVIEPYGDKMYCYFGTYDGPDEGVNFYQWFQDTEFGHHMMFFDASNEPNQADGDLVDCSDPNDTMDMRPLLSGNELLGEASGRMVLSDGLAIKLKSGQRYAIQSHYLNSTGRELLVRDAVNLGFIDVDDVENWVGAWSFNTTLFSLPPGEASELAFSCSWPQSVNILSMMGHMHSWGTSIRVTHEHDGDSNEIYSLPEWDPTWQNQPRLKIFADGELAPEIGDTFSVTCDFLNTTDESLEFPAEMCVSAGLAWPVDAPIQCDAGRR